jgi:hypothetical protein
MTRTEQELMKDSKAATEADIALLEDVFAFLVDNRDVAVEFCAHLLTNMGNQGAERAQAIFELKAIVFCAMCDAETPPSSNAG